MLTYLELSENFEDFKVIFANASHAPFTNVGIYPAIQPGQVDNSMEARRRWARGRPPIYLEPDTGFVAKIIMSGDKYDLDMVNKDYTFLITPTGGISFRRQWEFGKQPKQKWAYLISKWLQKSISHYRQVNRTKNFKMELISAVYQPERIMRLYKEGPDFDNFVD